MDKVINMDDAKSRSDRGKALSAALAQIEKQFGKGSIMRLADAGVEHDINSAAGVANRDIALRARLAHQHGGIAECQVRVLVAKNLLSGDALGEDQNTGIRP